MTPPFQQLVDDHADALVRHLRAVVGPHDAHDVAQETFLAALRAWPDLRHTDNLRGWLYTIAHRKVIDAWRATGRRVDPVSEVPDRGVTPPEPDDDAVWAAVAGLPPAQRAAVALRFLDDLSYAEIAAICDCSEGAARQRVHDAVRSLRRTLPAPEVTP
ncbi:MAG TPA: RNA polymerase sigma factor [Acidimicrobiales bacterium]|nr:RNA polymerase sigma factor [Acidimicrobiales bacterium]